MCVCLLLLGFDLAETFINLLKEYFRLYNPRLRDPYSASALMRALRSLERQKNDLFPFFVEQKGGQDDAVIIQREGKIIGCVCFYLELDAHCGVIFQLDPIMQVSQS